MRTPTDNPASYGWLDEHIPSISIRIARAELWANQPPTRREETMERVRRNVADHPNSYLAKHWRKIYE